MRNGNFAALGCLILIFSSCGRESAFNTVPDNYTSSEDMHGMIVLGRQLDDPYSVDNMTKALASLYPTKATQVGVLEATHYYVRVLPKNGEELDLLENLGLQFLDHPMDYEIVREGDYYHDPSIPQENITWLYAAVPVDIKVPQGIVCEVLDKCYIVGGGVPLKSVDGIDWDDVEREAFRITGNESLYPATRAASSNVPKGRITVLDQDYDSEPVGLAGVKVSCNVFVKTSTVYTDDEGYYEMSKSFASDPRYRIEFSNRKGFSIGFNKILVKGSVSSLGKHSSAGVNVNITPQTGSSLFSRAAVNNSVYAYLESCKSESRGIKAPPKNLRIWLCRYLSNSACVMMQQGVMVNDGLIGDLMGEYSVLAQLFLPDVVIGLDGNETYASLFSSTVHELSHASHFMLAGSKFWTKYAQYIIKTFISSGGVTYGIGIEPDAGYCEVGEMWAYFNQTMLYNERYPYYQKSFGTNFWFYPQIFTYLDSRGMDRFSIFPVLTQDITDRYLLKDKLISYYPELKNTINQAFARYQ